MFLARLRIDKEDFGEWLTLSGEGYVGIAGDAYDSPLCRYFRACGAHRVRMREDSVVIDGRAYGLPKWARKFEDRLAFTHSPKSVDPDKRKVTVDEASHALSIACGWHIGSSYE